MEYQFVEGCRVGSRVMVIDDSYVFILKSYHVGYEAYQCRVTGCMARVRLDTCGTLTYTNRSVHSHPPESNMYSRYLLNSSIKQRVLTETGSLRSIFNDQCSKAE